MNIAALMTKKSWRTLSLSIKPTVKVVNFYGIWRTKFCDGFHFGQRKVDDYLTILRKSMLMVVQSTLAKYNFIMTTILDKWPIICASALLPDKEYVTYKKLMEVFLTTEDLE